MVFLKCRWYVDAMNRKILCAQIALSMRELSVGQVELRFRCSNCGTPGFSTERFLKANFHFKLD